MNLFVIICLAALEFAGLFLVIRLWIRREMSVVFRLFWSVFLLIPVFGLLVFAFIRLSGEKNPGNMFSDSDYGGSGQM
jgi:drug/metabolite transporter superfamily protein YnfA